MDEKLFEFEDQVIEVISNHSSQELKNDVGSSPTLIITFDEVLEFKKKLNKIFCTADIDNINMVDFGEFQKILQTFFPMAKQTKIQEMLKCFENQDSKISYNQFLSIQNFDKFLKFCGYIISNTPPSLKIESESLNSISMNVRNTNNSISKPIINDQKDGFGIKLSVNDAKEKIIKLKVCLHCICIKCVSKKHYIFFHKMQGRRNCTFADMD